MEISTEVKEALSRGKPVVALESTIITQYNIIYSFF